MVGEENRTDFKDIASVGTPAADIVRVLILEDRRNAYHAWEDYYKKRLVGGGIPTNIVRARIYTLFMGLVAALDRRWKKTPEKLVDLEKKIIEGDVEDMRKALRIIETYLDEIRLTRLDVKQSVDRTRIEDDNASRG